jgi:hypothetical protein
MCQCLLILQPSLKFRFARCYALSVHVASCASVTCGAHADLLASSCHIALQRAAWTRSVPKLILMRRLGRMDLAEEAMHSSSISRHSALLVRNFFPRPRSNRNPIHRTPGFIAIADEGLFIIRAQLRLPPGAPGFSITPLDLAESPFFRPYLTSAVRNFAGGLEVCTTGRIRQLCFSNSVIRRVRPRCCAQSLPLLSSSMSSPVLRGLTRCW